MQFEITFLAGLDGSAIELALSYRENSISREGMLEIARTLESAIEYIIWRSGTALGDAHSTELVRTNDLVLKSQSEPECNLGRDFFRYQVRVEEDEAISYWRQQFAGAEGIVFPAMPSATYWPQADKVVTAGIAGVEWASNEITIATAVRAAWAILQAQYTDADDAVFGAPVAGVERIVRSTVATVPVRVAIDREETVGTLLRRVQDQAAEMAAYEQAGLQWIRQVSEEADRCCAFQTLLVVQAARREGTGPLWRIIGGDEQRDDGVPNAFNTYALMAELQIEGQSIQMRISFDSKVIEDESPEK